VHNIWIIIRREYLERVRTKSFWITTFLVPALMGAFTILPAKIMMNQRGSNQHIAVVTSDPAFADVLQKSLQRSARQLGRDYQLEPVVGGTKDELEKLKTRVRSGELDGMLVATDDLLDRHKVVFSARTTTGMIESGVLRGAARIAYLQKQLASQGVNPQKVEELLRQDFELDTIQVTSGKESKSSGRAAFFLTMALVMILYMSILLHGIAVMRSVLEEKTSRIVEVLLASVTPKELMAGKILGVGAVGLTQLAVWYGAGAIVGTGLAVQVAAVMGPANLPVLALALFPVFFILGYFLYASLWAMLGAMSNSEQEAQQMQFFVMLPLILSTVLMGPAIINPNSPMIVAASLFPFCTPLVMYMRIAAAEVPAWQITLSIVLMLVAVYVVIVVASRIYRVGILMYGKRPTLPELIKWFRYA
jgi:ABC-2 type transport system permease protein